jgi:hypothetical protein
MGVKGEARSRGSTELKLFEGKTGRGRSEMIDLGPGPTMNEHSKRSEL